MKFYTIDILEVIGGKIHWYDQHLSTKIHESTISCGSLCFAKRCSMLWCFQGWFITKNVFFYIKKRRRRKKMLFLQWFLKKTLKMHAFSCFSLKKQWILLHLQDFQVISLKTCRFCTQSLDFHESLCVCKHYFHEWAPWACGTLLLDCILVVCFGGMSGQRSHGLWQLLQP